MRTATKRRPTHLLHRARRPDAHQHRQQLQVRVHVGARRKAGAEAQCRVAGARGVGVERIGGVADARGERARVGGRAEDDGDDLGELSVGGVGTGWVVCVLRRRRV